ncbi:hypothetical protein L7F22_001347 [Adiantum nelumboides]|nr:hypothetical protein [Adiantum nelumboides]
MADNNEEGRIDVDNFDFANEGASEETPMLVNYLITRLQQAMANPALQCEVQQQLQAYGFIPPHQEERIPEKSLGETSKRGTSKFETQVVDLEARSSAATVDMLLAWPTSLASSTLVSKVHEEGWLLQPAYMYWILVLTSRACISQVSSLVERESCCMVQLTGLLLCTSWLLINKPEAFFKPRSCIGKSESRAPCWDSVLSITKTMAGGSMALRVPDTRSIGRKSNEKVKHLRRKEQREGTNRLLEALQNANKLLLYVVLGSTLTALAYPPSFSWFTNRYYTPALGFLKFPVGINLNYSDFINAFKRPSVLAGRAGHLVFGNGNIETQLQLAPRQLTGAIHDYLHMHINSAAEGWTCLMQRMP